MEDEKLNNIQEAYVPLLGKYLDEVQKETHFQKNLKTLYTLLTGKNKKLDITTLKKTEKILIKIFGEKLKSSTENVVNNNNMGSTLTKESSCQSSDISSTQFDSKSLLKETFTKDESSSSFDEDKNGKETKEETKDISPVLTSPSSSEMVAEVPQVVENEDSDTDSEAAFILKQIEDLSGKQNVKEPSPSSSEMVAEVPQVENNEVSDTDSEAAFILKQIEDLSGKKNVKKPVPNNEADITVSVEIEKNDSSESELSPELVDEDCINDSHSESDIILKEIEHLSAKPNVKEPAPSNEADIAVESETDATIVSNSTPKNKYTSLIGEYKIIVKTESISKQLKLNQEEELPETEISSNSLNDVGESVDLTTVSIIPGFLDLTGDCESDEKFDLAVKKAHRGIIDLTDLSESDNGSQISVSEKKKNDIRDSIDSDNESDMEIIIANDAEINSPIEEIRDSIDSDNESDTEIIIANDAEINSPIEEMIEKFYQPEEEEAVQISLPKEPELVPSDNIILPSTSTLKNVLAQLPSVKSLIIKPVNNDKEIESDILNSIKELINGTDESEFGTLSVLLPELNKLDSSQEISINDVSVEIVEKTIKEIENSEVTSSKSTPAVETSKVVKTISFLPEYVLDDLEKLMYPSSKIGQLKIRRLPGDSLSEPNPVVKLNKIYTSPLQQQKQIEPPLDNLRPEGEFYTPEKDVFRPADKTTIVRHLDNLTTGEFTGVITSQSEYTGRPAAEPSSSLPMLPRIKYTKPKTNSCQNNSTISDVAPVPSLVPVPKEAPPVIVINLPINYNTFTTSQFQAPATNFMVVATTNVNCPFVAVECSTQLQSITSSAMSQNQHFQNTPAPQRYDEEVPASTFKPKKTPKKNKKKSEKVLPVVNTSGIWYPSAVSKTSENVIRPNILVEQNLNPKVLKSSTNKKVSPPLNSTPTIEHDSSSEISVISIAENNKIPVEQHSSTKIKKVLSPVNFSPKQQQVAPPPTINNKIPVEEISTTQIMKELQAVNSSVPTQQPSMPVIDEISIPPLPAPVINQVIISKPAMVKIEQTNRPLRPWITLENFKSEKSSGNMLKKKNIFNSLYKCMEINCSQITDNSNAFLEHVKQHERIAEEKMVNGEETRDTESWLYCSYCPYIADTCNLLIKHIKIVHSTCIYNCCNCFYRSSVAYNVKTHYQLYHPDKEVLINIASSAPLQLKNEIKEMLDSRKKFVNGIECEEDGVKFFALQDFADHLDEKHTNGKYTCHTCGVVLPVKSATKHLLCHKIGSFACIFCDFGTNSEQIMQNHMSNKHSTKLLYACGRYPRKNVEVDKSTVDATILVCLEDLIPEKYFTNYSSIQSTSCNKSLQDLYPSKDFTILSLPELKKLYLSPKMVKLEVPTPVKRKIKVEIPTPVKSTSNPVVNTAQIKHEEPLIIVDTLPRRYEEESELSEQPDEHLIIIESSNSSNDSENSKESEDKERLRKKLSNFRKKLDLSDSRKKEEKSTKMTKRSDSAQQSENSKKIDEKANESSKRTNSTVRMENPKIIDEKTTKMSDLAQQPEKSKKIDDKISETAKKSNLTVPKRIDEKSTKMSKRSDSTQLSESSKKIDAKTEQTSKRSNLTEQPEDYKKVDEKTNRSSKRSNLTEQPENVQKNDEKTNRTSKRSNLTEQPKSPRKIDEKTDRTSKRSNLTEQPKSPRKIDEKITRSSKRTTQSENNKQIEKSVPTTPKIDETRSRKPDSSKRSKKSPSSSPKRPKFTSEPELPTIEKVPVPPTNKRQEEIDKFLMELVKTTGFEKSDLYRCDSCKLRFEDRSKFQFHVLKCFSTRKQPIKCFHCACEQKTVVDLIKHLSYHQRKRFFCFFCDDKSINSQTALIHTERHLKNVKVFPLNPEKTNRDLDLFVVAPKHKSELDIFEYGLQLIKGNSKNDAKISFHPNEISELPKTLWFDTEMSCTICQFSTKIRADLVKHFKKHGTSKLQISPVKILKKPIKDSIQDNKKLRSFPDTPKHISDDKRFTCGAIKCNYNTRTASMLKAHLSKHKSGYNCPHCKKKEISSDELFLNHLDLHGNTLYKCSNCKFYDSSKSVVLSHTEDKHKPAGGVLTIREIFSTSIVKVAPTIIEEEEEIPDEPLEKSVKRVDGVETPTPPQLVYCCAHCIQFCDTIEDMKKHWKAVHKSSEFQPSLEFQFKISKIVSCFVCKRKGLLSAIEKHIKDDHSLKPLLMVNSKETNKCSECTFKISNKNDFETHFKNNHSSIVVLDQALLDKMLTINNKKNNKSVRYYCTHMEDKKMCKKVLDNQLDAIKHMRNHSLFYGCIFCEKRLTDMKMIQEHQKTFHRKTGIIYPSSSVTRVCDNILGMHMIFPNGLTCTNHELSNTCYGKVEEIKDILNDLNERDKQEVYDKKVAEKLDKKLNTQREEKRKSERNQQIQSDISSSDDEELNENSSSKKRKRVVSDNNSSSSLSSDDDNFVPAPKKLRRKRRRIIVDSSDDDEIDEDENKIKFEGEYSFYGLEKTIVDYTKIFTLMNIGQNSIRMSCDKFGLIFDMQPSLTIEKLKN